MVWSTGFLQKVHNDVSIPEFSNIDSLLGHGTQKDFHHRSQIFLESLDHFILKTNILLYFSNTKVWLFESHDFFCFDIQFTS